MMASRVSEAFSGKRSGKNLPMESCNENRLSAMHMPTAAEVNVLETEYIVWR